MTLKYTPLKSYMQYNVFVFLFFTTLQCKSKYCDLPVECKVCGEYNSNTSQSGLFSCRTTCKTIHFCNITLGIRLLKFGYRYVKSEKCSNRTSNCTPLTLICYKSCFYRVHKSVSITVANDKSGNLVSKS